MKRVFLVEDDEAIRELVVYSLNAAGFSAQGFASAGPFYAALREETPDLVMLDIMLPGEDGLSILKTLRASQKTRRLPAMMLTARGAEYDKVLGLDAGADDYIAKPFGVMELLARVRALLRRTEEAAPSAGAETLLAIGELSVDEARHTVHVGERAVGLTLKEHDLLVLLLRNRGQVFTREQLLERVWGYGYEGETRTVDVHVRTLRQKLGSAGVFVHTVRGVGYKLDKMQNE